MSRSTSNLSLNSGRMPASASRTASQDASLSTSNTLASSRKGAPPPPPATTKPNPPKATAAVTLPPGRFGAITRPNEVGRTLKDTDSYRMFADIVEPVRDDARDGEEDELIAVDAEFGTTPTDSKGAPTSSAPSHHQLVSTHARHMQRLTTQEERLLAAVDNRDPLKVSGGEERVLPVKPGSSRPSSAGFARPTSAGQRPPTTLVPTMPRANANGTFTAPAQLTVPKVFQNVLNLGNRPSTAASQPPTPVLVEAGASSARAPRPPTAGKSTAPASTSSSRVATPPPPAKTAVSPRPTSASTTAVIEKNPTPSERIAHHELGTIVRTSYQAAQPAFTATHVTYRKGPKPISACDEPQYNQRKGIDPNLSHFIDANSFYMPAPGDIMAPGTLTHARYVLGKKHPTTGAPLAGDYRDVMRSCRVVAFHPDFNTYTIEWVHDGVQKVVKPLAIMLPNETATAFLARVNSCVEQRDYQESVMRFEHYAQQKFDADVAPLSRDQLSRIATLVAPTVHDRNHSLIQECVAVEKLWTVALRESIARYHLQSRVERAKVAELRLPHWHRPTPNEVLAVPATVEIPGYDRSHFTAARQTLGQELFLAYEPLHRVTTFAVRRWSAFEHHPLVITDVFKHNRSLPMEVSDFKKMQGQHNALVVKALEKEWISSIAQTMQAELEGTFNFFLSNNQAYQNSRMSRYVRSINLLLSSQLQTLIYNSLQQAQGFFSSLRVDADTLKAVRDEGTDGARSRKSDAFLRRVGCFGTKSVVPPPFEPSLHASATNTVPDEPFGVPLDIGGAVGVVQGTVPVLVCRFSVETRFKKILCTPSLEETEDAVREMYSIMLENTDALTGIGPQLFPMLNIRSSNLTEYARSVRRTDVRVKSCEKELLHMLDENLSGPRALLGLYQPFTYLLLHTADEYLHIFKSHAQGSRSVEDFEAVCDRLSQHIEQIEQRSLNEVVFPLIRVDCHGIKVALGTKAKELLHAMLKELVSTANHHIDAIDDRYRYIHVRIQREPQSPEELQELRAFIDNVPRNMDELQANFDVITQEVQLLGKYGYMPDQRAFEKYWGSYSWPRKISIVMDDVPFQLQMFRAQFLARTHETTETLQTSIQDLSRTVNLLSYEENEALVDEVVRRVATIDDTLQKLKKDSTTANAHEAIFQQPITKWPLLKDIEKSFLPVAALWRVTAESREMEHWSELSMERLNPSDVSAAHSAWVKEIQRLGKLLLHEISYTVVKYVKDKLEAFKTVLPVISALAKPSLLNRRRHIARIAEMLGANAKTFDLKEKSPNELVRLGILQHMTVILEISENADHEFKLETQLASMRDEWQRINFTLQPYMDTSLLKDTDDIRNLADEHVIKTQTMLASPYASAIMQELKPWEETVTLISRTLDAWLQCQFGFRYLSPMFTQSEDIAVALPDEAKAFDHVYTLWRAVMDSVGKVPSVLIRCSEVRLMEQFLDANVRLDKIMKELCKYLDQKREVFPRFYFLSNEDLIEVLSRSREPNRIQPFIQKCFEGIHHLTIEDSEDNEITEMVSSEGETVGFYEPIFPGQFDSVVDRWLVRLEQIMLKTVHSITEKALQSFRTMERQEWVRVWPGQVCIAASQITWTMGIEDAFARDAMGSYLRQVNQQVRQLALMVREPLSTVEMCTLQALIVIMVHAKDVTESLFKNRVDNIDEFAWVSQLRYYWENRKVLVKQTIATLPYGNEYIGNSSRLVITPLTDRCYRTLTAAYHLNYGGAPEGPAGTGKTETTKDLAKAIAKMCVVFNCSDQIKAFEMEKLLRGLAATGSWGCFDEFNRIEVQVLSVIAQQVLTIQLAVAQKRPQFLFEDRLCALKEGCSVFITMNPGYAGRTELPDNLKSLFRPVAMMVPDYVFIAENSLYSCGFLEATELAKKIVAAYKLSSEQLSSQSHYDFGMRAVKSVLSAAQNLRQQFPHEKEVNLVMRAIMDVNKPKFLANDALLFEGIMSDLFGQSKMAPSNDEALDEGIRMAATRNNFQLPSVFLTKVKQLYELIRVRHGVMVVGQSVSGKTAALTTLASGLTWAFEQRRSGAACTVHTLNPKAVTMAQLYGHNDASGTEWYDGILSNIFRECAADTDQQMRHWITLDGPVDALWIENMNTVLDDNKKLCLSNGDMVRMTPQMTMLFVVQDLFAASPATVSRCGMVYFEPQELGWRPLFDSWKATVYGDLESIPTIMTTSEAMVTTLLVPAVKFAMENCVLCTPHTSQMIMLQFFRLYGLLLEHILADGEKIAAAEATDVQQYTEGVFYKTLVWSLGGLLRPADRDVFDRWMRDHIDLDGRKADAYHAALPLPEGGSVFQYKLEVPKEYAGRPQWIDWLQTVEDVPMDVLADEPIQDIVVNTVETVSISFMSRVLMKQQQPTLIIGPTATGKTMLIKNLLKMQNPMDVASCHIQFNAQSSAKDLQSQLESRLERRGQRRYGPPLGKSMIAFVDDLGMPEADAYGTQSTIELLRQLLVQGGLYSTNRTEFGFRHIQQLNFISATQPAGQGRSMVTNRLLRHFTTFYVPASTHETMRRIVGKLFDWTMLRPNVNPTLKTLREGLVAFTVDTFFDVSDAFLPSPSKSHYLFNLRDLGRVWLGVSGLHPPSTQDEALLVTLVVHECIRVFGDRLATIDDVKKFEGMVDKRLQTTFKRSLAGVVGVDENSDVTAQSRLMFTNFIAPPKHVQATSSAAAASKQRTAGAHAAPSAELQQQHVEDDNEDRPYIRVPIAAQYKSLGEDVVREHVKEMTGGAGSSSDLVVFDYLVQHVARIARVIQQPNGSVLLMGLGGTGRRSSAKIAAHICGFVTKSIRATAKYTRDTWTEDVILAMRQAGERGISLLFILSDTDIKDEGFLDDVCSLLNSGDVPGLLNIDVQDAIAHSLKNVAKESGRDFGRDGCMELFVQRVRMNLHFALCFSPAGDTLRIRLRRFPSLVNCTTMSWMPAWPSSALARVAESKLIVLQHLISEEERAIAARVLQSVFHEVTNIVDEGRTRKSLSISMFLTPTAFLDLLETFIRQVQKKNEDVHALVARYQGGLEVIGQTERAVAAMQHLLEVNRPRLIEKQGQVAELIAQIDDAKALASQERELVAIEEDQANRIAQEARAVYDDCEANLAIALPAMNAATEAVSQIDKKQLVELRSLANPSDKIKKVIEAVCIVLEVKPKEVKNPKTQKKELDYWTPTKTKVMAEVEAFREMLMDYDKDNMKPEIFEDKILPFIKDKSFRPEAVKDVSQALVGVTQWVLAMETYYRVRKVVKPKQEKLAAAQAELKACQEVLDEKKRSLQAIDDRLADMTMQLQNSTQEKEALEAAQRETEIKLARAIRLNIGLADEKCRYSEEIVRLTARQHSLFGDCLYTSLVLGTLGPLPQEIRQGLRASWEKNLLEVEKLPRLSGDITAPDDASRTFNSMLSTAVEELQWKLQGLPLDSFSVDSAIVTRHSIKAPFIVDPQGQAVGWIRRMAETEMAVSAAAASPVVPTKNSSPKIVAPPAFAVVKHDAADLHAFVKNACVYGTTLLIEDCPEELDPFLNPVLDREVTTYNGAKVMTLGETTINFNDNVKLILATKIARPVILPSTSARVAIVQFSITPSGLTEQLLQRVIAHEDRDQESKRNMVVEQQANSQEQLIQLENSILAMLSSGRDMLADDAMCEQLDDSKRTSQTLVARLADAETFTKNFDKIRQRYFNIATKSSALFFIVASLPTINSMYEFSLAWFTQLMLKALERPHEEGESRQERGLRVLDLFYELLFVNVSRAMFAKDKLSFSLMMCLSIMSAPDAEVRLLVRGPLDLPIADDSASKSLKKPEFLSDAAWTKILQVSEQAAAPLSTAASVIAFNDNDTFGRYCTEEAAHSEALHAPMLDAAFAAKLTPVQRLIVVSLLAPRFVVDAAGQIIASLLGQKFVEPPNLDIELTMRDMKDPTVPLVFVLAPGGDPLAAVRRYAELQGMTTNLDTLSLGSGMDTRAVTLIKKGAQQGRWVVLQNCHLFPNWMPQLDSITEVLSHQRVETNNTFRLILTTASSDTIPKNLLQRCVKAVLEPPQGMRSNLSKLLSSSPMTDPAFFEGSKNPSIFKRLTFSLCLFHSVVLERRSFGPLGWNIPYDFTEMDLRISLNALQLFVDRAADRLISEGLQLNLPVAPSVPSITPSFVNAATAAAAQPQQGGNAAKGLSVKQLSDEELTFGLSFDALQYLIGECNYGGRVTDVHDRRLLLDLLKEFVGPKLFDDEDPLFPVPAQGDIRSYQVFAAESEAQQLHSSEILLGLDPNALIAREERQGQHLFQLISGALPKTTENTDVTAHAAAAAADEEQGLKAAADEGKSPTLPAPHVNAAQDPLDLLVETLLAQLPPPFVTAHVEEKYPPSDYLNSLNAVLVQELERFNRLTRKITGTLRELRRALRGEAALTTELDTISQELTLSITPKAWKSVSYPCLKPVGSYIQDLAKRLAFFQKWIDEGPPAVCWMGGLFFPQSFVTGTLQNYCRRMRVPIDALTWRVNVLPQNALPAVGPETGCYLSGMFLEGCRWDSGGGTLAPSLPKVLLDDLPVVHLFPWHISRPTVVTGVIVADGPTAGGDELDFDDDDDDLATSISVRAPVSPDNGADNQGPTYTCPVYRTQDRHGVLMTTGHSTNFLMSFELPIPAYTKPSTWVKRGVAIFTTSSL